MPPDGKPDLSKIAPGLRSLAMPIAELQFDPANARKHGEKNIEAIKGSLAVYGQRRPVVFRKTTGVVIAGNGLMQAALALGWTHLAALAVDDDAATAAGFAIADNRTAELADWDKDALDKLMREAFTNADERLDQMLSELATAEKLIPKEEEPAADQSDEVQEKFQVLVICKTVEQQTELLERLAKEGYECRSLIS